VYRDSCIKSLKKAGTQEDVFHHLKHSAFQRTPDAAGAILFWMSRAFVKEDVDLPERSGRKRSASGLPPGATNYITARGAKHLRAELQKLRAANANSKRVAELEQILASVHVVDPTDPASNSIAFGATVTVKDKKGRTETYTIVGLTNSISNRTPSVGFLQSARRSSRRTWATGLRLRMDAPRKS
jgi:hypothetical protein